MKVLKKMRYIFGVLLVVPLLFSGTPVVHGFATDGFSPHHLEVKVLMPHIFKPQWKIGYRYHIDCKPEERQNGKELEDAMSASLRSWLEPLKELQPGRPIVDRFVYELQPDFDPNQFNQFDRNQPEDVDRIREILREEFGDIDLRVTFECTLAPTSFARIGELFPPMVVMRMGTTEVTPMMLAVLTHEFGHAFGLLDTYVVHPDALPSLGGLKQTIGTQPASVMAALLDDNPLTIGEDDKRGIIWLYKYHHENLAPGDCFFDDYVSVEYGRTTGGCEPRYPFIFETKHNPPEYALQLLEDDPAIDINAQDVGGMTALHYAVMYEKVEIVQALLAHEDIKPSLKNKQGQIPLDTAHAANHIAIINMFPKNKQDHTPLDVAPGTNLTTTWGAMKQQ
ncbi:MAG: ankyrin repeat domain-containing protein [Candidatus Poribacteria bacterium]|nr:ankyrin repeat domain-containing protein [Candidatus Poribacteria bacterium]